MVNYLWDQTFNCFLYFNRIQNLFTYIIAIVWSQLESVVSRTHFLVFHIFQWFIVEIYSWDDRIDRTDLTQKQKPRCIWKRLQKPFLDHQFFFSCPRNVLMQRMARIHTIFSCLLSSVDGISMIYKVIDAQSEWTKRLLARKMKMENSNTLRELICASV